MLQESRTIIEYLNEQQVERQKYAYVGEIFGSEPIDILEAGYAAEIILGSSQDESDLKIVDHPIHGGRFGWCVTGGDLCWVWRDGNSELVFEAIEAVTEAESGGGNKWQPISERPPLSLTSRWVVCTVDERKEIMIGLQFRNPVTEDGDGDQEGEWGTTREGYIPRAWLPYDPSRVALEPELPLFLGEK